MVFTNNTFVDVDEDTTSIQPKHVMSVEYRRSKLRSNNIKIQIFYQYYSYLVYYLG